MPNHCEQTTIITGPKDERDRFVDSAKDEDGRFSLSVFHPMPEGLKRVLDILSESILNTEVGPEDA